ncbi:N-6 DNA methylase [Pseudomonas sp. R2-7-07]|uniref:class I SAM-dependent DNA methyltransferase n=1 Tax=Pseudomonas sp. R2-7-07 TaxID=658641 RepID=UPI000F58295F|nr:N-6 DNA methylase [Pseudomonas sp. R2-7-07]AZF45466.1 Type I restriction-modification system, DNA-methyltransferase subunit M [Pseudomonas sp. R2-7-07]
MSTNSQAAQDIGATLWSLCHVLRDDGVTYHQYLSELTYLLFLKMMKETGQEEQLKVWKRPKRGAPVEEMRGTRWDDLLSAAPSERLDIYKEILLDYSLHGRGAVQQIYANANTFVTKPATLSKLVQDIDALDWYSVQRDDLGDLYEDLLERNATEKKSGAGQYFTPRCLIDSIVAVMKPSLSDVIQDPAAGTCGFLIAANNYLRQHNDFGSLDNASLNRYCKETFHGMELVQDTHRLALMNMLLHGIEGGVTYGDTLSDDYMKLPPATLIFSNPPFGTKKGGGHPTRTDLPYPTSNKQFAFLQHIYKDLEPGGRAAVVLPDNVLFESNVGTEIRRDLMDKCNLHTILRLPTGIFYAPGVKTNVLFFTRGESDKDNTKELWVYDMRANMPQFGKRTPLTRDYFRTQNNSPADLPRDKFEDLFGNDPQGGPEALAKRVDAGEAGRWRRFTREQIVQRGDNLDVSWLKDETAETTKNKSDEPALVARLILCKLNAAVAELSALLDELGEDPDLPLDELLLDDETDSTNGASCETEA